MDFKKLNHFFNMDIFSCTKKENGEKIMDYF
jgi:hypothetical protein